MASNAKPKFKAFWTVPDIAQHVDVSPRTVWRWIDAGDLVAHRFGKPVRVSDGDFHAFLAQSRDV
jgi:excisionase family DNA binding protein